MTLDRSEEWDEVFGGDYEVADLLVFSDWLEERGSEIASAVRLLAEYLSPVEKLSPKSGIMTYGYVEALSPTEFVCLTALNFSENRHLIRPPDEVGELWSRRRRSR